MGGIIMCTAMTLKTKDNHHFFGRNLDVPQSYGQHVLTVPRQFKWKNTSNQTPHTATYACVGMGIVLANHPLLFDAVNEAGLAGAGLNFTRYAQFSDTAIQNQENVSSADFLYWALSQFSTVKSLKKALEVVVLTSIPAIPGLEVVKLHWIFTDLTGQSIVVEYMEDGMHVHDNPVGVLTNDPTFDWHLTNLKHYATLTSQSPQTVMMGDLSVTPFGSGTGRFGIPADGTPASRFISTVFYRDHVEVSEGEVSGVSALLEVLDRVVIPKGAEVNADQEKNFTLYQSAMCQESRTYYYADYHNRRLNAVRLTEQAASAKTITRFDYLATQDINFQN